MTPVLQSDTLVAREMVVMKWPHGQQFLRLRVHPLEKDRPGYQLEWVPRVNERVVFADGGACRLEVSVLGGSIGTHALLCEWLTELCFLDEQESHVWPLEPLEAQWTPVCRDLELAATGGAGAFTLAGCWTPRRTGYVHIRRQVANVLASLSVEVSSYCTGGGANFVVYSGVLDGAGRQRETVPAPLLAAQDELWAAYVTRAVSYKLWLRNDDAAQATTASVDVAEYPYAAACCAPRLL